MAARPHQIAGKRGDQPVDTGFIVFNYVNYPHLTALFDKLDADGPKRHELSASITVAASNIRCVFDTLFAHAARRAPAIAHDP